MRRGKRYGPGSPRKRPHDEGSPSRDTATSREREGSGEALRREPDNNPEVAQSVDDSRFTDGTEGGAFDCPEARAGGRHRRLPAAHPLAAGRLPVWPPAHDPAPDPIVAAQVPRTAWDQ